jgi:hypothetical protein
MTRNDARKIIKTYAQSRYPNSIMLLLLKLVDLTYRKDKDNAEIEIDTTAASLMKAARVRDRQLRNIITELAADQVLLDVTSGRRVSCRLNLEPLARFEVWGDKQKAERRAADAARTKKARERRHTIKELSQQAAKIADAVNADLREKTIKEGLLKHVPEGSTKRHMMNWSIDRIMRAQRNAEGAPTGDVV